MISGHSFPREPKIRRQLHIAAANGNLTAIEAILRRLKTKLKCTHKEDVGQIREGVSIEVNSRNEKGSTPLMHAAWKGREKVVRLLLSHYADPFLKNNSDFTAYDIAEKRKKKVVAAILEAAVQSAQISAALGNPPAKATKFKGLVI